MPVKTGYIHGTGADLEISIGFIPDWVRVVNYTDGDIVYEGYLKVVIPFSSGGGTLNGETIEIKKGNTIRGLTTTGATAKIREVILDSGSWSGGDAAGWFIVDADDLVGTFTSENVEVNENGTNSAAVTANVVYGTSHDTDVAQVTTDDTTISPYKGSADSGYSKGFKIGATISENAKLLHYIAVANDPGNSIEPMVGGLTQATLW